MPKVTKFYYPRDIKQQILDKIKNLNKLPPKEREMWLEEYKIMEQRDGQETVFFTKEEIDKNKYSFEDLHRVGKEELQKSKMTTIRMPRSLLNQLKSEAQRLGIPYQTLIKSILHQYFENKKAA